MFRDIIHTRVVMSPFTPNSLMVTINLSGD